ncbi:multi-sensor hybrid histidine kinase [Oscillochloris trichoides DG-6]|uniref:histidine kinase n=1 Tax=Oscillochloris trichoides DG-6 TaxID=765420 RepID=E1IHA2_9CHLR|nr:response regulator [Oscillochloris trichoides]EFO79577.1 multi-sensor hybrid histidine kinase [Oscillochloris trichoides DG-6]
MEEILIIDDSEQICDLLANYVLPELGYHPLVANTGRQGLQRLRAGLPDLILLDLQLPDISGLDLLRIFAQDGYDVPVILMTAHGSENIAVEAFRLGARNYLIKPFSDTEARAVIDQALRERRLRRDKERLTASLQQRVQELTVLSRIGKSVTGLMDQEQLLERIVEAGVYITQAEEGFLLLRDEQHDELYLRAAKNLGEQRAQSLRMAINDTLAGQVVRTAKPVRTDKTRAGMNLKVKTGFLVRAILQVPLILGEKVIGVLAVDNQQSDRTFSENDQYLLATLADYAAIAIENARLYEQVRLSERRYKDLFANAYDLIFMLDGDLCITTMNKAGSQITGYPLHDLIAKPLQTFCTPEAWDAAAVHLRALLAGHNVPPFEVELINQSQEPIYLEVSAHVMQNGSGKPSGLHCIARNLTDRRRLEQQLIQSEKLSAIGQLVAGVAHELNNPLTSVSGYAQLTLRNKDLSPETRQDIEQIHAQSERAAKIVQNLLIFAREHTPERSTVVINEVLRSALALQAYQLRVDNIAVQLDLDPNLSTTIADPHQLQQVFLNLITNARHAMVERGGAGTLTLRTRVVPAQELGQEPMIRIEVADTGIGIPERNLRKIFNPFFTTKPIGQGTGLGLSICFGIIQEHDGQIWAESQQGAGTRVYVTLPVRQAALAQNVLTLPPEALPRSADHALNILVIDDEEPVLRLIDRLLHEQGHHSTTFQTAAEGLQAITAQHFDVILCDVRMPGMNGFEMLAAIRQRDPELAERLIFMTGDTLSQNTREQLEESGNVCLPKPFAISQLETTLQQVLKRRSIGSRSQ